ncbi:MAG: hypothetical protein IKV47_07530 [Oscillospiraceae bacterium]|nr:hypothetical protein [Oscillospiraceae bacterium]
MLRTLIQQFVKNIRSSSLAKNKGQLIRTIVTTVVILAVIIAIIIIRSDISPKDSESGTSPGTSGTDIPDNIDVVSTTEPTASEAIIVTPSPTPTPEPPAITPPADSPNPASGTDIIFESEPPTTDTDISTD